MGGLCKFLSSAERRPPPDSPLHLSVSFPPPLFLTSFAFSTQAPLSVLGPAFTAVLLAATKTLRRCRNFRLSPLRKREMLRLERRLVSIHNMRSFARFKFKSPDEETTRQMTLMLYLFDASITLVNFVQCMYRGNIAVIFVWIPFDFTMFLIENLPSIIYRAWSFTNLL